MKILNPLGVALFCSALVSTGALSAQKAEVSPELANEIAAEEAVAAEVAAVVVADVGFVQQLINRDPREIVAKHMDLTAEEAERFWPLYDTYEAEMEEYYKGVIELVFKYGNAYPEVSEEVAGRMLEKWIYLQQNKRTLKLLHVGRISSILPANKTFRFVQIEGRIDALVNQELTSRIPLVPESGN